ncbi:MAG: NAD(P)/FAD-dependent oxidoreductase [Deferribacterota bacterium]|nr:NAD(P)/FAD-dependent oxidoreductase [Deferribacterota bacterium]
MIQNYSDVVVIGAGPSGLYASKLLSDNKIKPLVISENIGGNYCRNGALLSNTLLYLSSIHESFLRDCSRLFEKPLIEKLPNINMEKLRKYFDNVSNRYIKSNTNQLEKISDYINGYAKFTSKNTLEVDLDGKKTEVKFRDAIIATGSKSIVFDSKPILKLMTTDNFFTLEKIPESVIIIGGGFVGCEFASFFKRMGSDVLIIEKESRLLNDFEEQIVKKFQDNLIKNNIKLKLNAKVDHIDRVGNKGIILFDNGDNAEAEEIFIAIGRKPNLSNIGLENLDIDFKDDIPTLDDNFLVNNDNIYIIGDATGINMSVPFTTYSAEKAVFSMLGKKLKINSYLYPRLINLSPDIASIGIDEREAIRLNIDYIVAKYTYSYLKRHVIESASTGLIKLIYSKSSKKLLGAHIFGRGCKEIISSLSIVMQFGIKIDKLSHCFFNHPSYAEILRNLGQLIAS